MNDKGFDFDKVGKRMPYTVPEGFFDKLEEDVWKEVKTDCREKKSGRLRLVVRSAMAVAAAVALLVVINMGVSKPSPVTIDDVDRQFSRLSFDDQTYLLEIYQEDVFINE